MDAQKVLVLSPHTDDAELGSGGTMTRFIEDGREVHLAIFSICEDSLPEGMPKDTLEKEAISAAKSTGIKNDNLRMFKNKVRSFPQIRQSILDSIIEMRDDICPDLVIMPSLNDHHQDHQVLANEALRAFKTSSSIISYELPWNHVDFHTQLFVKLKKEHIKAKHETLKVYKSQLEIGRKYFSKEFIYGLASVRGTQCNSNYAEAFEVVRWRI